MDPTACFYRFVNCCCSGDLDEAKQAINDLNDWYVREGFPANFPRQNDGSATPIPAKFVHEMVRVFEKATSA